MQLDEFLPPDSPVRNLLQQSRYWQQLNTQIKKMLPENLHAHFDVICIQDNDLIVHTSTPMASTRLKMLLPAYLPRLQQLDSRIRQIVIKQKTQNPEVKREKSFRISPNAVQYFAQTTKRVAHYPELAQALENLVQHHQNENNNQM